MNEALMEEAIFQASPQARRLSPEEKRQFEHEGYVKNLPALSPEGTRALQRLFDDMVDRLPEGIDINKINNWHKASRTVFDLCRTPAILDYVEDIIGPDFFQWGCQLFVKYPNDGSVVPWHQDAQYWPLEPHRTVTVWLAVYDTDDANGAMQIVKGSHKQGDFRHEVNKAAHLVLDQEVPDGLIDQDQVITMDLKAGELSLHDDGLLHGSGANTSSRTRAGLTMRFCPTDVRCDLAVWPNFESYAARGIDRFRHNPEGLVPVGESYPVRRFQHSSEFQASPPTAPASESAQP